MHEPTPEPCGSARDFLVLSVSQFSLAFALNFMFVFFPFYIHAVSPLDEAGTLRWTGILLGAASAMAVVGSTIWGGLTDRWSPKTLFVRGLLSHAVLTAAMAFVTDLYLLLAIQLVRGFMGGISTIGLIIITAISREEEVARRMGAYQSALTLGQIFAPPLGAMAATAFGFQGAFLISSLMLGGVFAFASLALSPVPPQPRRPAAASARRGGRWLLFAVALAGTVQIVFLPAILPSILQRFAVAEAARVATAGVVVFASGVAAAAGAYGFSRLAARISVPRLMLAAAGGASLCQVLLILGDGPLAFTLVRMGQTACAAGIFPLVLARVAAGGRGKELGFVNAARFAGNAIGPLVATFVLANASLFALYCLLAAALGVAALTNHALSRGGGARPDAPRDRD